MVQWRIISYCFLGFRGYYTRIVKFILAYYSRVLTKTVVVATVNSLSSGLNLRFSLSLLVFDSWLLADSYIIIVDNWFCVLLHVLFYWWFWDFFCFAEPAIVESTACVVCYFWFRNVCGSSILTLAYLFIHPIQILFHLERVWAWVKQPETTNEKWKSKIWAWIWQPRQLTRKLRFESQFQHIIYCIYNIYVMLFGYCRCSMLKLVFECFCEWKLPRMKLLLLRRFC